MKDKSEIIADIARMILLDKTDAAKAIIHNEYPHKSFDIEKRSYTITQKMEQFLYDGFIDRYTGKKLLNPGILKVISFYFPDEFPYSPHWKMTQTHMAYWDLVPTIDHIIPIAKGGKDDRNNWVTTSMKNNSIKSSWTPDELGWTVYPKGSIEDWDGLTGLFIELVDGNKELLNDNYIKNWYSVSKKLKN